MLRAVLLLFVIALPVLPQADVAAKTNAAKATLLVIEKGAGSLAIVDPATANLVASVPENGVTGHEVAASADGRLAFVPIYGDSGVGLPGSDGRNMVVIDVASHQIVGNVDFGHGVRPHLPVLGPRDGQIYVTTELDQTVTVVDPKTLKVVGTIPTSQPESHMLALSRDGKRGYTANVGPGTVSVLDIAGRKTLIVIPVAKKIQRISISPDDRLVFTSDETKPQLAVIDTASNRVKNWIPLPGLGYGSAPTHDGRFLLLAVQTTNQLAVIDLKQMKVVRTLDVPKVPQAVLVRPGDKVAYVSCDESNQVAEIDLVKWKVSRLIATGKLADGMAWAAPQ